MKRWWGAAGALLVIMTGCGGAAAPAGSAQPVASVAATGNSTAAQKPAISSAAAGSPAASAGAKDKVRVGYLSRAGTSAITFVSKNAGLYDKYGVDAEISFAQPAILTTALNAGKDFDVGYASAANIPTINVQGGDLVMVGASTQVGIFNITGAPGIKSIADLKGKTAAVTSAGSTTDLLLRKVLQDNKLTPEKDVSIAVIAGDAALVAALTSHRVDAIVNSEPFNSIAIAQGGVLLYDQSTSGEPAIQTPVTVKRGYLPAHRDLLKRMLMANMEAIYMLKTNPAQAAKYSAQDMGVDDLDLLAKSLKHVGEGMDRGMSMPPEAMAESLKIAAANIPEVAKLKPEDLLDPSLLNEIKASGFLDKLYGTKA